MSSPLTSLPTVTSPAQTLSHLVSGQFDRLHGVRLLVSCFYPEWKEGGEVFSSLVESCQCTDSQTFSDICSLFGGEVVPSLRQKLPHHSPLILSVITTEYYNQHLLIIRSSDHHQQVVRS